MRKNRIRNLDEVLMDIQDAIRDFERKFGCSTSVMRMSLARGILDETPEIKNWKILSDLMEDQQRANVSDNCMAKLG